MHPRRHGAQDLRGNDLVKWEMPFGFLSATWYGARSFAGLCSTQRERMAAPIFAQPVLNAILGVRPPVPCAVGTKKSPDRSPTRVDWAHWEATLRAGGHCEMTQ